MSAAVFLLSAAVLAHEVCLLRVLSLAYWHHAAALVVSVALLGFGVAGTLLAAFPRLRSEGTVARCAALYALLVPLSVRAARLVDFNVLEVGWDSSQWLRLLGLEAIFFLPFLAAALGIHAALALRAERAGGIYGWNLLGSGAGALGAPLLLGLGAPADVLGWLALLAAAAALLCGTRRARAAGLLSATAVIALGAAPLPMSPFKDLPAAPDKEILETTYGPRGRVDVAVVPSLHRAPGLSLTAPAFPEDQLGIYVDGHLVAARDTGDTRYLAHTVGALPFVLLGEPRTLLLGAGPDLPRATLLVEPDANVLRATGAAGVAAEPRAYVEAGGERWDLVVHHVPRLHAAAETPLLTVEGLSAAFARSTEGLVLGCGLTAPPRPGLKLLLTAERVAPHVIAIRSADRMCLWLRRRAATDDERTRVLAFCEANGFDPVRPAAWRFEEPFHVADVTLDAPGPDYPYDLRPATDARPYFFKFFRWSRLGDLFDPEVTSFVQWPFVALLVALLQVTALFVALMAVPLAVSRAARAPVGLFVALGLGYMLVEMAFLQRAMVRLGSPVHAAAAVIGGFLAGSGCGSLAGERWGRPLVRAALAVAVLAPLGYVLLPRAALPAALVSAAVAFPMGIPFPAALARQDPRSVPWALAWNGGASVAAAAAAPLLSSTAGIPVTAGGGILLYLLVARAGRAVSP